MHYFLKPLLRTMRKMDEKELLLCIFLGVLMVIAVVGDWILYSNT
jgi:Kef-type K+ transport system membrane component KefB